MLLLNDLLFLLHDWLLGDPWIDFFNQSLLFLNELLDGLVQLELLSVQSLVGEWGLSMALNPFLDGGFLVGLPVLGQDWLFHKGPGDWAVEYLIDLIFRLHIFVIDFDYFV